MADILTKIRPVEKKYLIEQVSAKVLEIINIGDLVSMDLLPSERILASRLNVSRNTLRSALHILEEKGFLIVNRGKSTRIR